MESVKFLVVHAVHDKWDEPHERVDERVDEEESQLSVAACALTVHLALTGVTGGSGTGLAKRVWILVGITVGGRGGGEARASSGIGPGTGP